MKEGMVVSCEDKRGLAPVSGRMLAERGGAKQQGATARDEKHCE